MTIESMDFGPNGRAVQSFLDALTLLTVPELDAVATAANDFIGPRVTDDLRMERAEHMRRTVYAMEQQRWGMGFLSEGDRQLATRKAEQARVRELTDEPGHYKHAWSVLEEEITAPVGAASDARNGGDAGANAYYITMTKVIDAAKARAAPPDEIDDKTTEWLRPAAHAAERAGRVLVVQDLIPAAQFEIFAAPMRASGIDLLTLIRETR